MVRVVGVAVFVLLAPSPPSHPLLMVTSAWVMLPPTATTTKSRHRRHSGTTTSSARSAESSPEPTPATPSYTSAAAAAAAAPTPAASPAVVKQPQPHHGTTALPFGRQAYWEGLYEKSTADFSWYAGWQDLAPFVEEFLTKTMVVHEENDNCEDNNDIYSRRILLPGIGNDAALLRGMHASGYRALVAFDYAAESEEYLRQQQLQEGAEEGVLLLLPSDGTIELCTADVRDLAQCPMLAASAQFDAVLDKGTLDAVYLASKDDNADNDENSLQRAVSELQRVLKPGGVLISLAGILPPHVVEQYFVDCGAGKDSSGGG